MHTGGVVRGESLPLPRPEGRVGVSIGTGHVELEKGAVLPHPLISFKHTAANNYWNPNSLGENTELDPFGLAKYMIWKQTNAFFKTNPVQQFICKIPEVEQKPHKSFEAVDRIKGMLYLADVIADKPQREYKGREKYISMVGKIAHVYIRDVSLTSPFSNTTLSTLAKDASRLLIIALAKYRTILNSLHQWPLADRNSAGYRAEPVG